MKAWKTVYNCILEVIILNYFFVNGTELFMPLYSRCHGLLKIRVSQSISRQDFLQFFKVVHFFDSLAC